MATSTLKSIPTWEEVKRDYYTGKDLLALGLQNSIPCPIAHSKANGATDGNGALIVNVSFEFNYSGRNRYFQCTFSLSQTLSTTQSRRIILNTDSKLFGLSDDSKILCAVETISTTIAIPDNYVHIIDVTYNKSTNTLELSYPTDNASLNFWEKSAFVWFAYFKLSCC